MENNQNKRDTINSLREYLPRLESGIKNCVEFFRMNNEIEAIRYIEYIVEGLNWTIEAIILSMDSNTIKVSTINKIFSEIIGSIENKDYVLLADLLDYEVLPLIEEWQKMLG